jgi:hypothetical protein
MCIANKQIISDSALANASKSLSVAGAISGTTANILSGFASSNYYKALASSYAAQKQMNTDATNTQALYNMRAAADKSDQITKAGEQTFGAQKAAMAANGANMASVSAEDIVRDSAQKETQDQNTLAYNLDQTNFNLRKQNTLNNISADYQSASANQMAANAKTGGYLNGFASLVNSGATVAERWYKLR